MTQTTLFIYAINTFEIKKVRQFMVVVIWSMCMHYVDNMQSISMLQEIVHMITVSFVRFRISVRCRVVSDPDVVVRRKFNK